MTAKDEIRMLAELLPDEVAEDALDYLRWLAAESDTLSDDELSAAKMGDEEIARGEVVTLADLKRSLARWRTRFGLLGGPRDTSPGLTGQPPTESIVVSKRSRLTLLGR
jgi:hypothetical protein